MLMFLCVSICTRLGQKSTGALWMMSCMRMAWRCNLLPSYQCQEEFQRLRNRQEYAQSFQKLGCGPSQVQGTNHLTPAVLFAAKFECLTRCICLQNYNVAVLMAFFTQNFGILICWQHLIITLMFLPVLSVHNWRTVDFLFDEMEVMRSAVPSARGPPGLKEPTRVRTEFPETWLWSESIAGYQLSDPCCYLCFKAWITQPVHSSPKLYMILHVLFRRHFLNSRFDSFR